LGWGLANVLPGWPQTVVLLISASQVARKIGVSHNHLPDFNLEFPKF
jgi:hypothetical protein